MRTAVPARLAVRYWRRRWPRALLMLGGLMVGLTLLVAVLLVNDSLTRTYAGWARGVSGWADIEIGGNAHASLTGSWLEAVRQVPGVGAAAPVLERRSYLFVGEARLAVSVRGVDPTSEAHLRPFSMVAGRSLEAGDARVALLSVAAAVELDAGPGSTVQLLTPEGLEELRVVGVYNPLGAEAVSERVVQVPLVQAQALFSGGRDTLSRIDVATDGSAPAPVVAALAQQLGAAGTVRTAHAGASDLAEASRGIRTVLLLAGLLGVMAAGVLISVYVRAMVEERSADLSLLRGLGVPRHTLTTWLSAEVGAVVVAAAAPALCLAVPVAVLILQRLPTEILPFAANVAAPRIGASAVPVGVIGVGAGVAAALLLLRILFAALFRRLARGLLAGTGRAAWLRLTGHLLQRGLGPGATVAAALALTIAGLVGVHGASESGRRALTAWLDTAVDWDLMVAPGPMNDAASVTLPQAAVAELAALPGVEEVSAQRQVGVTSRGRSVTMIALGGFGLNAGGRLDVVQSADLSGSAMWLDLRQGQAVALSVALADQLAVTVGDRLPLTTPDGESEFEVVALVNDPAARTDAAYIALDSYAAMWGDGGVDSVVMRLSPGTEPVAVAASVGARQPGGAVKVPLHVTLAGAYRADLLVAAADTFRASGLMVLLALMVTLAALLATGITSAWQVEPEMRGLRAMGVPPARLATAFFLTFGLTAAAGAVPGMALGTLLSRRLAQGAGSAAWSWPTDAYTSVGMLLAVTALLAAALLVGRRVGLSPQRPRGR